MSEKKWNDLKDNPLLKLLHTISLRSDPANIMDVTRGMLKRRIYFKKGWPVNVSSNSMNDVLGRVMLEEGIISKEAYEKSLEIMLKQKKRHGEVLISMGFISQKELDDCLALQMKKKIWKIFGWPNGNYKYFLIKGGLPANLQLLPMNPALLIINGILNGYCQFEQVEALLKKFMDKPLTISPSKPYKIEDLGLNIQESRFLAKFDGISKTKEVINNSDLLHRKAELLTYGLIITDIISSKDEPVAGVADSVYKPEPTEAKEEAYEPEKKTNAELIFQNGKTYLAKKDYEKAATSFEEAVRLNPDEAEYKAYLGWAIFNKHPHDTVKAKGFLMESLSIDHDLYIAHLFLAKLYIREGLFKEAEGGLTAALRKNPFLPEARKELALIKIMSGSYIQKKDYVDYFHLTKNRFDFLTDPDLLYLGDAHYEALLFLLTNIKSGFLNNIKSKKANIILLTGGKGSGKTSLCLKTMVELADEKVTFVYIDSLNPPPLQRSIATENGGLDILIAIKNELGIKTATDFAEDIVSALQAHSFMCREARGQTVVILDNADKFNANALMAVRTLLQTGIDNIVLSGQPEIKNILNAPQLKEIKQGISGIHHLHPLGHEETKEYISKRLASASGEGKLEITPWAVKIIHNTSFGNPEIINKICDVSLNMAMKRKTRIIDEQIVKAAEDSIEAELDEKLPQIEPVEEKAGAFSEEEVRKIAGVQVAATVEEVVKREFEKRAAQFGTASIVDEVLEKAKGFVNEQVVNIIRDAVKNELDKRAVQQIEPVEEKAGAFSEEEARKIISGQIAAAVEEAVKKEFEKRAPQFAPVSVPSPPAGEDERHRSAFRGEGEFGGFERTLSEQITGIVGDGRGSEWSLPNFEEVAHQPDTSFVSFEADEKKNGFFAKNGFLIKTLIVVIAAGIILAVIANYNILQELNPFSVSNAPVPVKKVEPVNLPATEPPAIKAVPPEVQHAPEDKTALPEAIPETAPDVSGKPPDRNIQGQARLLTLTFEINGSRKETVFNGETLKVKRGDKIKIVSADAGGVPANDIVVNLLGFTGDKNKNTGEDRGYLIDTNRDMWKKYSTDGKGSEYPIIVKYRGGKIGGVILKITD
ncbi:MAG: AAA family ATPase [Deltaproteobacteria bacterium]